MVDFGLHWTIMLCSIAYLGFFFLSGKYLFSLSERRTPLSTYGIGSFPYANNSIKTRGNGNRKTQYLLNSTDELNVTSQDLTTFFWLPKKHPFCYYLHRIVKTFH